MPREATCQEEQIARSLGGWLTQIAATELRCARAPTPRSGVGTGMAATPAQTRPNRSAIASAYRAPDLAKELAHDTDLSETTAITTSLPTIVRS